MGSYFLELKINGDLVITYYTNKSLEKKYSDYLISQNVISFKFVDVGNCGSQELYFIKEDGTVGSADTELSVLESENIKIIPKLKGLKNIVLILNGSQTDGYDSAGKPIFLDINGNYQFIK